MWNYHNIQTENVFCKYTSLYNENIAENGSESVFFCPVIKLTFTFSSPGLNFGSVWSTGGDSTPSSKSDRNSVSYGSLEHNYKSPDSIWDHFVKEGASLTPEPPYVEQQGMQTQGGGGGGGDAHYQNSKERFR